MNNLNQKQKHVAIYCRTAVRDQKTKESKAISRQVMLLKEYAAKQGMKVIRVFVDDGFSGNSLDRPALNEFREAIKKGGIDALLIKHPDRLARNVFTSAELMQEFKQYGVELLFHDIPSQSPAEKLMVSLVQGFDEMNKQRIGEKVKRGLKWKKSLRCPHCHGRIFAT